MAAYPLIMVHLEPFDYEAWLRRNFIETQLAGSILAQALEDPTTEEIAIPNAVVTPATLQVLAGLQNGIEPQQAIPELAAAGQYLNIPQLEIYSDPIYDDLKRPTRLLTQAITEDKPWLVDYIHKNYNVPVTETDLKFAVTSGALNVVRMLVIWPDFNWSVNLFADLLRRAQETNNTHMREVLLSAERNFNNPGRLD
jgi:hypothetical protein